LGAFAALSSPAKPPAGLVQKVGQREALAEAERANYLYRQTVALEELSANGATLGEYREVREVIFSPTGERTERLVGKTIETLKRLKLTEEDFRDLRDVQPFLFTSGQRFLYETKFRGEETVDGVACFLLQVRPRQILSGQRLFDGVLWIAQHDFSIIRSEGKAVPQLYSNREGKENLFPNFTTLRREVGGYWFPAKIYADDTLPFRTGAQRVRLTVEYSGYRRFAAESKLVVEK